MVSEKEVRLQDGRTLRAYDSGCASASDAFVVMWHHGSPQTGAPPEPLLTAAALRGIRLLSYGRPSYGGSSPCPGRDVASAADDASKVADAFEVSRFAVMGASGGGPHALACAALTGRVAGVVCVASPAPFTEGFDWSDGMVSPGGLRAAIAGREARARYAETEVFDEDSFTPADWAALSGAWSSLGADAGRAGAAGPDGLIDDDVAFARPWGFDVTRIDVPVLLVQGGDDRVVPPAHAYRLLHQCPKPELWLRPHEGHVSILDACPLAMDWLMAHCERP